jgi:uncharacterized metal-binding protein YceD (DUF177 family)
MLDEEDCFKIYVEQLKGGNTTEIDEKLGSDFLEIKEKDLEFRSPVTVQGQAYVAGDELLFHLKLHTMAVMPCVICNVPVDVPITIDSFYEAIPLSDVPHGIFNMREMLREAILLETPSFAECHGGRCHQRAEEDHYFKKDSKSSSKAESPSPFDVFDSRDFES